MGPIWGNYILGYVPFCAGSASWDSTSTTGLLQETIWHIADPDVSLLTMFKLWLLSGVRCPICGHANPQFLAKERRWECRIKHANRQFSAKTGSVFEDSPPGLHKWFTAIWLIANCRSGVSSFGAHRAGDVIQNSAWFMLHPFKLAMQSDSIERASGTVEADETFTGSLAKNMQKDKKKKKIPGRAEFARVEIGLTGQTISESVMRLVAPWYRDFCDLSIVCPADLWFID